jgi:hypothetical protein
MAQHQPGNVLAFFVFSHVPTPRSAPHRAFTGGGVAFDFDFIALSLNVINAVDVGTSKNGAGKCMGKSRRSF